MSTPVTEGFIIYYIFMSLKGKSFYVNDINKIEFLLSEKTIKGVGFDHPIINKKANG